MATVSVDCEAPDEKGEYQGYWKLQNTDGESLGIGSIGASPFWVKIIVEEENGFVFDPIEPPPDPLPPITVPDF
jgi:hypothetical protein